MQMQDGDSTEQQKSSDHLSSIKRQLNTINQHFRNAANFENAWSENEAVMRRLLNAEQLRIYRHELFIKNTDAEILNILPSVKDGHACPIRSAKCARHKRRICRCHLMSDNWRCVPD